MRQLSLIKPAYTRSAMLLDNLLLMALRGPLESNRQGESFDISKVASWWRWSSHQSITRVLQLLSLHQFLLLLRQKNGISLLSRLDRVIALLNILPRLTVLVHRLSDLWHSYMHLFQWTWTLLRLLAKFKHYLACCRFLKADSFCLCSCQVRTRVECSAIFQQADYVLRLIEIILRRLRLKACFCLAFRYFRHYRKRLLSFKHDRWPCHIDTVTLLVE